MTKNKEDPARLELIEKIIVTAYRGYSLTPSTTNKATKRLRKYPTEKLKKLLRFWNERNQQ